jgi:hypothetical protein
MSDATVTYVSPTYVVVEVGGRKIRVRGEANIEVPKAPYFVYSTPLVWQAPHDADKVSESDKALILEAIRSYFDARGTSYIVDPTDEEYRAN